MYAVCIFVFCKLHSDWEKETATTETEAEAETAAEAVTAAEAFKGTYSDTERARSRGGRMGRRLIAAAAAPAELL